MEANLIFYVLNTAIAVIVALVCLRFLLQLAQANTEQVLYNSQP